MIKAIWRAFNFRKYRWTTIELKDGSILVGPVTQNGFNRIMYSESKVVKTGESSKKVGK